MIPKKKISKYAQIRLKSEIAYFVKEFSDNLKSNVEDWIDFCGPTWERPLIILSDDHPKLGLFISLTWEHDYDAFMPWSKFSESILDADMDQLDKFIPLFRNLLEKMVRKVTQYKKEMADEEKPSSKS